MSIVALFLPTAAASWAIISIGVGKWNLTFSSEVDFGRSFSGTISLAGVGMSACGGQTLRGSMLTVTEEYFGQKMCLHIISMKRKQGTIYVPSENSSWYIEILCGNLAMDLFLPYFETMLCLQMIAYR